MQSQAITFNANDAVKVVSDPGRGNNDQPEANKEEWTYDQRNVQNNNDQVLAYSRISNKRTVRFFVFQFCPVSSH